ncbi:hypothetical protein [Teredinibacter purpureus]|uniref:hypothetical protein n=1 Tax=Teredinibacter purpureus TaxID=2731756 RepID=UPI0005F7C19B|nr:hypothetical protein [Teredinibacter purpureus]
MKYKLRFSTLSLIFGMAFSQFSYSTDNNENWDAYLNTLDPYANESDKLKPQKSKSKKKKPNHVIKPRDLPPNATPQQISDYNQRMQKYLRANQYEEVEGLFETVESMGYTQEIQQPEKSDFTINRSETKIKGYSEKETNFNWGGKQSGYQYKDFEFIFESTNHSHVEKMSEIVTKLSTSGWEVDLNRSFQTIDGNGDSATAYTTTHMRFRKSK